jgi:hypothetical protein
MRVNWASGLWRLWLVLAIFWVLGVAAIFRPDLSAATYWTLRYVDRSLVAQSPGALSENAKPPDPVALLPQGYKIDSAPAPDASLAAQSAGHWRDETGNPVTDPLLLEALEGPSKFADLIPDSGLANVAPESERRLFIAAVLRREVAVVQLRSFVLAGLLPPGLVLAVGVALGWAIRGFRSV